MKIFDQLGLNEFNLTVNLGAINIITTTKGFFLKDRDPRWAYMEWAAAEGVVYVGETTVEFDLEGVKYAVVCWEYFDCSPGEFLNLTPDYLMIKSGVKFGVIKNEKEKEIILKHINQPISPYRLDLFKG